MSILSNFKLEIYRQMKFVYSVGKKFLNQLDTTDVYRSTQIKWDFYQFQLISLSIWLLYAVICTLLI